MQQSLATEVTRTRYKSDALAISNCCLENAGPVNQAIMLSIKNVFTWAKHTSAPQILEFTSRPEKRMATVRKSSELVLDVLNAKMGSK